MTTQVPVLKSRDILKNLTAQYWKQVREAPLQKRKIAWCSGISPIDLLKVMDFALVFPENYAAACGSRKIATKNCEYAESIGYSTDICSYARNGLGAMISGDLTNDPVNGLPKPDLLLANNYCLPIVKWFEEWSRHFKVPLIVFEQGFRHDTLAQDDVQEIVAQNAEQLKDIIAFLEQFTGKRFDYDKLKASTNISLECARLWRECLELNKSVPAPYTCFDFFNSLFPIMCLRGDPATVKYYTQLKADLQERISQKISAVPGEQYRLYWDNIPIWFKLKDLSQKFASYNASMVTGIYPYAWAFTDMDPDKPIDAIARNMVSYDTNTGIKGRAGFISRLIEDFSVDGLVAQSSRTCRFMNIGQYDIINMITQRTGRPAVFIEGDMCDERVYMESEINGRIDAFMELLAQRKKTV